MFALGWLLPVRGLLLLVLCPAHLCPAHLHAAWKRAESCCRSETYILPVGKQFEA